MNFITLITLVKSWITSHVQFVWPGHQEQQDKSCWATVWAGGLKPSFNQSASLLARFLCEWVTPVFQLINPGHPTATNRRLFVNSLVHHHWFYSHLIPFRTPHGLYMVCQQQRLRSLLILELPLSKPRTGLNFFPQSHHLTTLLAAAHQGCSLLSTCEVWLCTQVWKTGC